MKRSLSKAREAQKAAFADMGICPSTFYWLERFVRRIPRERLINIEVI